MWDKFIKIIQTLISWPMVVLVCVIILSPQIKKVFTAKSGQVDVGTSGVKVSFENLSEDKKDSDIKLEKIFQKVFRNRSVEIDSKEFIECKFINSTLVYRATGPVVLKNNTFEEVTFSFKDSADRTVRMLSWMYRGMGPTGQKLIDNTLEGIRKGSYID